MNVPRFPLRRLADATRVFWLPLVLVLLLGQQTLLQAQTAGQVLAWGENNANQSTVPPGLNTAIAVAGGGTHSLALKADGTVVAWGFNVFGQTNVPPAATNVVAIAAGESYSLALKSNGTVVVWGDQIPAPAGLTNVVGIAAGWKHSLALKRDGTVVAWGDNTFGETNVPAGLSNVVAIAAGNHDSLALRLDGSVIAWGDSSSGKTTVPASATNVVALAAGQDHCLALRADGIVIGWGSNVNSTNNTGQATPPVGLANVVAIAAGAFHSLALRADGSLRAWGDNTFNQGTIVNTNLSGILAIAAGGFHNLLLQGNGSPAITVQPANQIVILGTSANFKVIAVGNAPLSYQWQKNGTNVAGATTTSLVITNVQFSDAGAFSAVVTNLLGSVVSAGAILTPIGVPAIFIVQPQSRTNLCGDTPTFQVTATGPPPLTYQWQFNGAPINNATNTALSVPSVTGADTGPYTVVVYNPYGASTSAVATLTVLVTPTITSQPNGATNYCGRSSTLRVTATGPKPQVYQWLFNGTPLAGATASSLALTNLSASQSGLYNAVVACPCGAVTSSVAQVSVTLAPLIGLQPASRTNVCGETAFFQTSATGPAQITYQWLFNGAPIAGATAPSLIVNGVALTQAGLYSALVSSPCGSTTSTDATLTVNFSPLAITSPLTNSTVQGTPFTYQITGTFNPTSFATSPLPFGLSLNPTNGIISGTNRENGTFGIRITAANVCSSDTKVLVLNITSSAPVITNTLFVSGREGTQLTNTILATQNPTSFSAQNLPPGLTLDPALGIISGKPAYAGEFDSIIAAYNDWGVGTATIHYSIGNAIITGLSIANIVTNYSSPYLLEFQFSLRDDNNPKQGNAIATDPRLFTVSCFEDPTTLANPSSTAVQISPTEDASIFSRGNVKQIKTFLVLDFSASIVFASYTNTVGAPDAVSNIVLGAQTFVDQQPANEQIGVWETHRDDQSPGEVQSLTTDKVLLDNQIAGIWTSTNVNGFAGGSRCWDALVAAISAIGAANPDEQHNVVFLSDGGDISSTNRVADVIKAATNGNVRVYCVGFGNVINVLDLTNITSSTLGQFYTATNFNDLAAKFALIGKEVNGQYILRWATLRRGAKPFMPSFQISYGGLTATTPADPSVSFSGVTTNFDTNTPPQITGYTTNYVTNFIISPFTPNTYAGNVLAGSMRLAPNADVQPTGIDLRATYVPRYVRQILLHYRANWPVIPYLQSTNQGQILNNWSMSESSDGTNGTWLLLSSSDPQNVQTSIPFGAFGPLVTFTFRDALPTTNNAFALFTVDNSIYSNIVAGGQSFVVSNATSYVQSYPSTGLPFGTPIPWLLYYGITGNPTNAEVADSDNDGVPNWKEYQAGTNPTNSASKFFIKSTGTAPDQIRNQIVFTTSPNRTYRVDSSFDLVNWQTVQDNIAGTGNDYAFIDTRFLLVSQVYYRVLVY